MLLVYCLELASSWYAYLSLGVAYRINDQPDRWLSGGLVVTLALFLAADYWSKYPFEV